MAEVIEICGEACPVGVALEPCCKEPDHDGGHYWWHQAPWERNGDPAGIYGVVVWTTDPRMPILLSAVYNMEVAGAVTAEEVSALAAHMDLLKRGRKH